MTIGSLCRLPGSDRHRLDDLYLIFNSQRQFKGLPRDFYAQHNFADGFTEIQGMPLGEVQRLRNIEGIDRMEGRLIKEARVLLPGREENVFKADLS